MAKLNRKTTTAVVASVAAATLLLGGTFAWYSVSQTALNEKAGIVNVGGRLHDDFNGTNKDVYVENFTNPLDGGQPIYARIRLDEYMEVGPEAGKLDDTGNAFAADRDAESVVPTAKIDDVNTWTPHVPKLTDDDRTCTVCQGGETCFIHDHWTWDFEGSTTFMPTFNKDKDSLKADINGTYAGVSGTDNIHYDDYVTYTVDPTGAVFVDGTDTLPYTDDIYQKTADAYYDDDTDTNENDHVNLIGATKKTETHTAKETAVGTVISMADWLKPVDQGGKGGAAGDYWVYDTDGWAYWANPIMPGEATGLLLDGIEMTKNPGEKCYYAINVVGQFATVGDWEYFEVENVSTKPSANALTLLETASKNVPVVTVTQADGITFVTPGQQYDFNATVAVGGVSVVADTDFEWSVLDENLEVSAYSTIDTDGMLSVHSTEPDKTLTIVARSKTHGGAVGAYSVGVRQNVVTTDDLAAPAYVLLTENGVDANSNPTYTMSFIRSEEEPNLVANTYNDKNIYAVYADFENVAYGSATESTPWTSNASKITKAEIVNNLKPGHLGEWFYRMNNLTSITGLEKIDTSNVKNMNGLFASCQSLETITGIENWDVSNVVSLNATFQLCSSLKSLDLSGWAGETGNVTNMSYMFNTCSSLETLDLSGLDVSAVDNMGFMFYKCTGLQTLDLSGWGAKTGKVVSMRSMFDGCTGLTSLNVTGWDVSNMTDMQNMFNNCNKLQTLDISSWADKTGNVKNMYCMFVGCSGLTEIVGIGDLDVSSVTTMVGMFSKCSSLTTLDLSSWDTGNVTTMASLFDNCADLTEIVGIGDWDVSSVTTMQGMFTQCGSLTTLDLSGWGGKTGKVQTIRDMFYEAGLSTIDFTGWDTSNVTNMQGVFWKCHNLTTITGIGDWDVSSVTNMYGMFNANSSLTTITGIGSWDTSKVLNMQSMLSNCPVLIADCNGWTVNADVNYTNFNANSPTVTAPTWPTAAAAN